MLKSNKPNQFKLYFTYCCIVFLFIFFNKSTIGQNTNPLINDGPYIDYQHDSLKIQWVENGEKKDTLILAADATTFDKLGLPLTSAPITINKLST